VVRLSGPDARTCAAALCAPATVPDHASAAVRTLRHPERGTLLDQALVLAFRAPHSYTGEEVVELHLHGNPLLVEEVIGALTEQGARLAQPGEFTLRAFLNGRQDLTQAEAVHDLVEARSRHALRLAARQLAGGLGEEVARLDARLYDLAVQLEAELDFPDDVPEMPGGTLEAELDGVATALSALLESYETGRHWKEGYRVVLVGAPNVGKSSLFNALLRRDRAIVSEEAGTTRDYLEEFLPGSAQPVLLVDTAGVRETGSVAERAGVERSRRQLARADRVLWLLDGTRPLSPEDLEVIRDVEPARIRPVATKADLSGAEPPAGLPGTVQGPPRVVSSVTGAGLGPLRNELMADAVRCLGEDPPAAALTNARQRDAVQRAGRRVEEVRQALATLPRDILASQVRAALDALRGVTGHRAMTEAILEDIFSRFCIGK
jgi:tRNA modification GTPase